MKYKFFYTVIIVLFFFQFDCFSQTSDSVKNKAGFYYDNQEFQLAIPWFSIIIKNNPKDYNSFQYRGNCYLEIGQYDHAINDYLSALKLKYSNDLIFNLGNAYEKLNSIDSATYYFSKYIELEPSLPDGYIRLCVIYMYSHPELGDTAIYFASRAVKTDSKNTVSLNFLAMAYYSAGHYRSALETARAGLAIDSGFSLLNQTAGISSFFLRDYTSAISYFDRAFKNNPKDYTLLDYKIQSTLLRNTNPDLISFESGQKISIKGISSENINKAETKISERNGIYTYKKLLQKFRSAPMNMSIDEYLMLYIGYSLQAGYSPYHKPTVKKVDDKDLTANAANLEDLLLKNPTDFPVYLTLADIYLELGNGEKYYENRFKYFGFIQGIKAAGDGQTPETAFIVNDLSHEYSIMVSLGYHPKSQKLIKLKKHNFDVLTGADQNNKDLEIYFNIDKPFETLPKNLMN